jgi:hypothetical protein
MVRDSESLRDHDLATVPHWELHAERTARILQDTAQFLTSLHLMCQPENLGCRESLAEITDFTAAPSADAG